jgi:uncharacterized protein YggE
MRAWLLLPLALCASAICAASPVPDYPFIYAEGSANRDLPPDIATLGFTLTARHETSDGAIAQVQEAAGKALALLARAGIRDVDINAAQLNKSQQMRWDEKTRRNVPDGYEATRGFSVTVRDLARYPALLTGLLAMPGANGGGGGFDRADHAKVSAELVAQAAEEARQNAERMAGGLHRKLGAARAIAQIPLAEIAGRFGFGSRVVAFSGRAAPKVMARAAAPEDASLVPSSISISESVNVLFELQ